MVLAAGLPPQSTASGPKIKFFCVFTRKGPPLYEMGFDLLTCDGERVVEMYLVMPGFGRWLLGLASALCILDRRLAGGSGVNAGSPGVHSIMAAPLCSHNVRSLTGTQLSLDSGKQAIPQT